MKKAEKEMYIQLHNKISDIILELMNVQTLIEDIYAIEESNNLLPHAISTGKKQKKEPSMDSVVKEFSVALVSDEIDTDTISKLEKLLKQKRDKLKR